MQDLPAREDHFELIKFLFKNKSSGDIFKCIVKYQKDIDLFSISEKNVLVSNCLLHSRFDILFYLAKVYFCGKCNCDCNNNSCYLFSILFRNIIRWYPLPQINYTKGFNCLYNLLKDNYHPQKYIDLSYALTNTCLSKECIFCIINASEDNEILIEILENEMYLQNKVQV